MSDVIFEQRGQLGIITLDRPAALNALTHDMVREISAHLSYWETLPVVKAVVIQSKGEKSFCAGGDIRQIFDLGKHRDVSQLDFFRDEYQMNAQIHHYPKPYVALMNGVTMGGGVGISLHGSHPVASERFLFAMPETGIGFFPDIGASFLLSRTPGRIGEYLALSGTRLDQNDALYCGLIKHIVPHSHFPALFDRLCMTDLSDNPAAAVEHCIAEFEEKMRPPALAQHVDIINHCFAQDSMEEIIEALRHSGHDWALNVSVQLSTKSPLSLKVTLLQIRRARRLDVNACLQMDDTLVRHFMSGHDFYEGVRALIIDKDKSPRWSPPDLHAAHDEIVFSYFSC